MAGGGGGPPPKKAKADDDDEPPAAGGRPVLGYWKIRGLAAAIRYQLAYSGVDFDEVLYELGDGPEYDRSSWTDVKPNLGLAYPNIPYLKDGDYLLTESGAIHRYCARKWRPELLHHDDPEAYGRAEMAWGVVSDLKGYVTMQCYRGQMSRGALAGAAVPRFATIAGQLSGAKFLAGDGPCCADFALAELVEMVDFLSEGGIYKAHPSIKEHRDRVFDLPGLKEYYADCPKLPFNNKSAKINNM